MTRGPIGPYRGEAVILLGRGGYGEWPQRELDAMVEAVRRAGRYTLVTGALVDQGELSLPAALEACVAGGYRRIIVAPVFVPMDRSLRVWLPKIVRRWLRRRPGVDVEVVLARALGEHEALGEAVARAVAEAEGGPDVRENAPVDRGDPSWSAIPPHRYHVLTCGGPRCTTNGAGDLRRYLSDRLEERGLTRGPGRVLTARAGCLYPCNLGPLMLVYPDGIWYRALNEAAIDRIVEEHLIGGRVVEELSRAPGPRPHKRPDARRDTGD